MTLLPTLEVRMHSVFLKDTVRPMESAAMATAAAEQQQHQPANEAHGGDRQAWLCTNTASPNLPSPAHPQATPTRPRTTAPAHPPTREPPVLQDLEHHVEHVGVRLLDLVKQHHAEGLAPAGRARRGKKAVRVRGGKVSGSVRVPHAGRQQGQPIVLKQAPPCIAAPAQSPAAVSPPDSLGQLAALAKADVAYGGGAGAGQGARGGGESTRRGSW